MPLMISDTDLHVAYNGPDARFKAGVERFVRDSLVQVALEHGARKVEGKTPKPVQESKPTDEAIQAAIQSLLDDNAVKAFGADGAPKVRSIEKLLGENIDAADRDRVWDAMNDD